MRRSVAAAPASTKCSPTSGARPCGRKCSANPGRLRSGSTWSAHLRCTVGGTAKPRSAYSMAGASTSAKGRLPSLSCRLAQPATQPGMVTLSQPRSGIAP
ncbi:Uncharacterised protein [Bordetella pertussis]|nr:Uncharacterised protein [Bordetella pertussis]CFW36467.1 Uncharacterised protein [Bordetella pertussis]